MQGLYTLLILVVCSVYLVYLVDIEDTDVYSRYSKRYHAAVLFLYLWNSPHHRASIRTYGWVWMTNVL